MRDLTKVAKPSKDNWKLWVTIGNDLIDEYEEILGLSEPEIDDTGYRDKIRDSITSVKDMFALLEAESAFKKRQKRKDLDDRWNYWKKVILKAYKDVPGLAKDAYKNIIRRRDKIYFAATDSSDPALGGSSGFDPGTKSTGTFTGSGDDVEADAIDTQQNTIKFQGKRVPKLNKDNWKQWIVRAQRLLAKYAYTYGSRKKTESINEELKYYMRLVEKPKDNIDWSKIEPMSGDDERDWNQIKNMFSAMGATLPDEATKAWEDLEFQKSKGDVDVKAKQRAYGDTDDPALGGSSGFDPGTKSTGTFTGNADDIEQDAMLANLPKQSGMGMQSQIDPSNRVSKDQKNRDGYTERIQRLMYSLNMGDLKNSVRKAKTELRNITAQLPNAEAAKYSTIFYSLLATKLGLQGFVRSDRIVFADGSTEKVDANNDTHKEIVQAQFDLDLIDSTKANKLVDLFDLQDLPSSSGMSQQMKHGSAGFKNTGELKLKGTSKTLPPLTSDTYKEYVTAYQKILRKYKSGSGKGGGYKDLSKESIAEQIRHSLNLLLVEKPMKINQTDANDLAAIEKAFQTAAKRKAIKPAEHDIFKKILQQRDEITKQSASTKGNTPDTLKKAMAIKAPGSDTNYGVYNDQIMAVLSNPTADNLVTQANKVLGEVGFFDTKWNAMNNFYGIIAQELGLEGLISHVDTAVNPPQVFYSRAKQTELSKKLGDKMPRGEFESDNVDFSDPKHRKIAQAQLDKNLLPASITYQQQKVNPQEEFGITKQEPQEPEKTGDVSPTVKSGERTKPADLDTADELQAAGQATTDTGQTTSTSGRSDRPSADGGQAARKVGSEFGKKFGQKYNKDKMPTGTYAYDRYVPIPKNLNRLFRGERTEQYYVDRIPLPGQKLLSNQLQITSDTKGTGFETVHDTKFNRARDAIMQFLKDNNTSLIDQAEWAKLKKWNDVAGDGPGGGDILNAPNDPRNKNIDTRPQRVDFGNTQSDQIPSELPRQDVGSWGTDTSNYHGSEKKYPHFIRQTALGYDVYVQRPEGVEKVQGGPFKTEEAAKEFARGRASKIIPDPRPSVTVPTTGNGKSDESDLKDIQTLNAVAQRMLNILDDQIMNDADKKTAYNNWFNTYDAEYQDLTNMRDYPKTSDELKKAINDSLLRQKNVINTYKKLTANAGPPANKNQADQQDGKIINAAPDSSFQDPVPQRRRGNIPGLDAARKEIDNSSTDFTRLLKNAGLLKEFY